jgi:hypothetical protein
MNYPTELQHKMAAASAHSGPIMGAGAMSQHDAINQIPQRDKPPVEVSAQRLFEHLGQLQARIDQLIDRLSPVSRPETTGAGNNSARIPGECTLVTMLDQAADRVEHMAHLVETARDRLCI